MKKPIWIVVLLVFGIGLFFAPMIYKSLFSPYQGKTNEQVRDYQPKGVVKFTPLTTDSISLMDKVFDLAQKGIGVASASVGMFMGFRELRKKRKSPVRRKTRETKQPS